MWNVLLGWRSWQLRRIGLYLRGLCILYLQRKTWPWTCVILVVFVPRFQFTRSSQCVQLSLLRAQELWKCLPQRERSNASESWSSQVWHTPPLWCYGGECWWHPTPRRIYSTQTTVVWHQPGKINPHIPAEKNLTCRWQMLFVTIHSMCSTSKWSQTLTDFTNMVHSLTNKINNTYYKSVMHVTSCEIRTSGHNLGHRP